MEVVSHCAFPVAGRVWRPRPGAAVLTFVAKATFTLAPGKLALAPDQQPVHEYDRPWSESVTSLYAAADLVPRKARPDVVLIGNAYAPGGAAVQKVVARLAVGEVDKSVEVWCDRVLQADGAVVDGRYFTSLPLLYERAAGGPGTDNPVGLSPERNAYGSVALPNLTPPGTRPDAPIKPTGFGPLAGDWPTRLARLGRYGEELSGDAWHDRVLPQDFDMGYFNAAPPDQQPGQLRADERIVLENLHRKHPQLVMTLPAIRLRANASGPGGERAAVLSCDTLWIDTSSDICCLTYRGQVLLSSHDEGGWVVVSVDPGEPEEPVKRSPRRETTMTGMLLLEELEPEPPRPSTVMPPSMKPRPVASTLPFIPSDPPKSDAGSPPNARTGLPFQSAPDSLVRPDSAVPFRRDVPPPPPSGSGSSPGFPPGWSAAPKPKPPPPPLSRPQPITTPPAPPPLPPPVQPSRIMPAPVLPDSPWALAPASGGPAPGTIAPVVAAVAGPALPGDFRSGGGALLASNAAAGTQEALSPARGAEPVRAMVIPAAALRPAPPRLSSDALELVFFDPESLPRIRRVAAWKPILTELADRPIDAEEDDPIEAKEPAAVEDRREIIEILLRADAGAIDAASLDDALRRAVREDGRYLAPLLLVSGELTTPFDEIETLKATITTAAPLTGNDEPLRASVEIAKDFLKLPGLSSSPAVADGLTARVRDAFNNAKRAVQAGYLDAQTERALVDQRSYQHRLVLGGRRQRALFQFAGLDGSSGLRGGAPTVTYLPESAAAKLPLFARFKVRLIARLHLPLDQYEQGPALEALAMARLCPAPRRDLK